MADLLTILSALRVLRLVFWLIGLINKFLPKYKISKKAAFWQEGVSASSSVIVSIELKKVFESKELSKRFLSLKKVRISRREGGFLSLRSNTSGILYEVRIVEKDEERSIITVKEMKGICINKFGIIQSFDTSELQEMVNLFSEEKAETEKIEAEINLNRGIKGGSSSKKSIKSRENNSYYSCTIDNIKVVTEGLPKLRESMNKAFSAWIEEFV